MREYSVDDSNGQFREDLSQLEGLVQDLDLALEGAFFTLGYRPLNPQYESMTPEGIFFMELETIPKTVLVYRRTGSVNGSAKVLRLVAIEEDDTGVRAVLPG